MFDIILTAGQQRGHRHIRTIYLWAIYKRALGSPIFVSDSHQRCLLGAGVGTLVRHVTALQTASHLSSLATTALQLQAPNPIQTPYIYMTPTQSPHHTFIHVTYRPTALLGILCLQSWTLRDCIWFKNNTCTACRPQNLKVILIMAKVGNRLGLQLWS